MGDMSRNPSGNPTPSNKLSYPLSTFVIRIWKEWSTDGGIWRGNIEHLESKKRSGFQDLEGLQEFLQSFGLLQKESGKIEHQENQINT